MTNNTTEVETLDESDELSLAFSDQSLTRDQQRTIIEWIQTATSANRTGGKHLNYWMDKFGSLSIPQIRYILSCIISATSNLSSPECQGLLHLSRNELEDIVQNKCDVPSMATFGTLDSSSDHGGRRPPGHYQFTGKALVAILSDISQHERLELRECLTGLMNYTFEVHSDSVAPVLNSAISRIESKKYAISLLTKVGAFRSFTVKALRNKSIPSISFPSVPSSEKLQASKRRAPSPTPTAQPKRSRPSRSASASPATTIPDGAPPTASSNNSTSNAELRNDQVPIPPTSTRPVSNPTIDRPASAPAPSPAPLVHETRNIPESDCDVDRINPSTTLHASGYSPFLPDHHNLALSNALATLYPQLNSDDYREIIQLQPRDFSVVALQPLALHNLIMHSVWQQTRQTYGFGHRENATNQIYEQRVQLCGNPNDPNLDPIRIIAEAATSEDHVITFLKNTENRHLMIFPPRTRTALQLTRRVWFPRPKSPFVPRSASKGWSRALILLLEQLRSSIREGLRSKPSAPGSSHTLTQIS